MSQYKSVIWIQIREEQIILNLRWWICQCLLQMTSTGQVQALIKVNLKNAELITEFFNGSKNRLKNRPKIIPKSSKWLQMTINGQVQVQKLPEKSPKIAKHQPPNHHPKCPQNRPSLNQSAVILPRKRNFIIVSKKIPKVAPYFNYYI